MKFRRRSLACLLLCVAPRLAHADPSASELSAARHAFEVAVGLENDQHWAEAALKLREAIAVKDTPGLRFHLAHCETEQGHLVEALLEYERASDLLHQGAKAPDVQKLLGPASDALKDRVARLSVELPADSSNPVTALDGKVYPPSELILGLALNPGRHELRVSAAGRRNFERAFSLREREQVTIRAELSPSAAPVGVTPAGGVAPVAGVAPEAQAAPPASAAPAAGESQASSAKVYLLVGESVLTVAGLAVGIGYQLSASSATDRANAAQARIEGAAPNDVAACGSDDPTLICACSDLNTALDDHDHASVLSTVGFVTAGVGAAALLTTWLIYPNARQERSSSFSVRPVAGLGRIGLIGSF